MPAEPLIFSAIVQPHRWRASRSLPPQSAQVEFEGEIGVVIGRRLRHVSEPEAIDGIAAIVAINDVTARDLQRKDGQWTRAKGVRHVLPGWQAADRQYVRGPARKARGRYAGQRRKRQHGKAADMAFSIPFLVSYISGVMTLEPGDLIATGTPAGSTSSRKMISSRSVVGVSMVTKPSGRAIGIKSQGTRSGAGDASEVSGTPERDADYSEATGPPRTGRNPGEH